MDDTKDNNPGRLDLIAEDERCLLYAQFSNSRRAERRAHLRKPRQLGWRAFDPQPIREFNIDPTIIVGQGVEVGLRGRGTNEFQTADFFLRSRAALSRRKSSAIKSS